MYPPYLNSASASIDMPPQLPFAAHPLKIWKKATSSGDAIGSLVGLTAR